MTSSLIPRPSPSFLSLQGSTGDKANYSLPHSSRSGTLLDEDCACIVTICGLYSTGNSFRHIIQVCNNYQNTMKHLSTWKTMHGKSSKLKSIVNMMVFILCKYWHTKSIMTENILQTGLSNLHCCVRRVKNKLNQLIMLHAIGSVCFNDGVYKL